MANSKKSGSPSLFEKSGLPSSSNNKKRKRVSKSSKELNLYFKSYKGGGCNDPHLAVFQQAQTWTSARRVLYPGCHRHLTAALVFPEVTFVDNYKAVGPLYIDDVAAEYVDENKVFSEVANYEFFPYDVYQPMPKLDKGYFDMVISLNAGLIADPCTALVKPSGYLLVNDSHSDARTAFLNSAWELVAYWDNEKSVFCTDKLDLCFQVKVKKSKGGETKAISEAQVKESFEISAASKRSFRMAFDSMIFLFRKKSQVTI